jgi:hypothetical protein
MSYVNDYQKKRKDEYLEQGYDLAQANIKFKRWMQNHTTKQKKVFKRNGLKYIYVNYTPYIDSGCEKWYVDIDYNTNICYLYHKNRENGTYHFQQEFNKGKFITDNLINICNYIWGHSNKHIQKDFNNTLRDKLYKAGIEETLLS